MTTTRRSARIAAWTASAKAVTSPGPTGSPRSPRSPARSRKQPSGLGVLSGSQALHRTREPGVDSTKLRTSAVLPTPDSPLTTTTEPPPEDAASPAAASASSSSTRSTRAMGRP